MLAQRLAIFVFAITVVAGQRPSFAGFRPIGYPDTPNRTTTVDPLGNRFGEGNTTTERLPIEANGDRDLVDRLSKLPLDKQPFWLLNWQALEELRKNPQTYPQKPNQFAQPSVIIQNTNPLPPPYIPSNSGTAPSNTQFTAVNTGSASSSSGLVPASSGLGPANTGFTPGNTGTATSNSGFRPSNSGLTGSNSGFRPPTGNNVANNLQSQNSMSGTLDGIISNSVNQGTTDSVLGNRFGEDSPPPATAPTKTPDNSPDPFGNYPIAFDFNKLPKQ